MCRPQNSAICSKLNAVVSTSHEAVAWGMRAAVYLAESTGYLSAEDSVEILDMIANYGPIPPLTGIAAQNLFARLVHDKKTVQGKVHFVLPVRIGEVTVASDIEHKLVLEAIRSVYHAEGLVKELTGRP